MRGLLIVLTLLLAALQYGVWFGRGGLRDVDHTRAQIEEQVARNEQLEMRNRGLAAEVADLKDGMDAVEELARSEMGMVREGEVFFQMMEKPAPVGSTQ